MFRLHFSLHYFCNNCVYFYGDCLFKFPAMLIQALVWVNVWNADFFLVCLGFLKSFLNILVVVSINSCSFYYLTECGIFVPLLFSCSFIFLFYYIIFFYFCCIQFTKVTSIMKPGFHNQEKKRNARHHNNKNNKMLAKYEMWLTMSLWSHNRSI